MWTGAMLLCVALPPNEVHVAVLSCGHINDLLDLSVSVSALARITNPPFW